MAEGKSYDYVIVGAGSAGCVLAYRLTADPPLRVLLLDAGGRDTHPLIHIPIGLGKIWQHRMFDWAYDTEPEPRLGNRRIEVMRGKVLGGSSSINVMAYVRGHRGDYEHMPQGCVPWPEELARPCGDRSSWRDIAIGEHLDAAIARGGRASAGTGDPRATPWWRAASVRDAHSPRARRSHRPRPR